MPTILFLVLPFLLVGMTAPTFAWGVESAAGSGQASTQQMLSPQTMRAALEFTAEKVNAVSTATDLAPNTDFQAKYITLSRSIIHPLPAYQFANKLNQLLASLHDAHTVVDFVQAPKSLPIQALWLKEGLIVTEKVGPLAVGDRIVRLGAFKTNDLFSKLRTITPSENEYFVRGRAPTLLLREDFLRSIQAVDASGNVQVEFERQGLKRSIQMALVSKVGNSLPWYSLTIDEKRGLARIQVDSCDYNSEFAAALRAFMQKVKDKKIAKLVVDLRKNRGGDALVAFALAAYINPDYRSFSAHVRRSADLLNRVPVYAQFLNEANHIPGSQNLHELSADMVKAVSLSRLGSDATIDAGLRFQGQVFLLTSPVTFSSANLFATIFKDNQMATIVGEPTGNEVEFRGEGVTFDLAGTPLRLTVSATRYQRPDQERADSLTLMPDVLIPTIRESILNGTDPQLDAIAKGIALPEFQPSACVGDDTGLAPLCGYVSVPENRLQPDGAKVRLAVRVFHRLDRSSREAPLVYLHGGPGTSGLAFEGKRAFNFNTRILPFLEKRDVILFDQRGVGLSLPTLDCPEFPNELFPRAKTFVHREQYMPTMLSTASACASRLRSSGIRLESYNSNESADDADDIRRALNIDTWSLLGNSYGTRLGLNILRRKPDGVQSAVFSSLHPPQLGIDSHARFAALVETYFARYPELKAQIDELVPRLNQKPMLVKTSLPFPGFPWSGREIEWLFSGDQVSGLLYGSLYSPVDAEEFKKLVTRLLQGDTQGLDIAIAKNFVVPMSLVNIGSLLATNCNDKLSRISRAEMKRMIDENPSTGPLMYGRDLMWGEDVIEMCHAFVDPRASDPRFSEAVHSLVPTLLVSGEFDSATPPENAVLAAKTLKNAQMVVVRGAGHAPVFENACTRGLALGFLRNPQHQVDTGCLGAMP